MNKPKARVVRLVAVTNGRVVEHDALFTGEILPLEAGCSIHVLLHRLDGFVSVDIVDRRLLQALADHTYLFFVHLHNCDYSNDI